MKSIVLISVLSIFCALAKDRAPVTAGCLAMVFLLMREGKEKRSWLLAAAVFLMILFPRFSSQPPTISTGRVVHISAGSFWLQRGRQRVLVYCSDVPVLDSTVTVSGTLGSVQETPGFYRFDFSSWGRRNGIYYTLRADSVNVVKQTVSLRGLLQRRVLSIEEEESRMLAMRILFGVRLQEDLFESQLEAGGFSVSGVILLVRMMLERFFHEKERNRIELALCIGLSVFYHFPILLVSRLIASLLRFSSWNGRQRTSVWIIALLSWKPESAYSAAFLLPCAMRMAGSFAEERSRRSAALFYSLLVQSVLFHQVFPLTMIGFSFLMAVKGGVWLLALITVLSGFHWLGSVYLLDSVLVLIERFRFAGSVVGPGLVLFVIACSLIWQREHRYRYGIVILLVFLRLGLFHPFAEVTAINVGQGTSILFKGPFNRSAVLLDTGKPAEADNVMAFLQAKGITRLDALLISHSDSDHSGGVTDIAEAYQPSQIMIDHQEKIVAGDFTFYDLNELKTEDENQSSLVLYTEVNGIRYLCMGDGDEVTEEAIRRKYLDLGADILMLAHHGSATGNSERFLDHVQPALGIISCGAYGLYHHPSPIVIQRLLKRHIPYVLTREQGDITVFAIGPFNVLVTSHPTIGLIARGGL